MNHCPVLLPWPLVRVEIQAHSFSLNLLALYPQPVGFLDWKPILQVEQFLHAFIMILVDREQGGRLKDHILLYDKG